MAARALTEAGLRVLILDRGRMGHRAEETHFDQTITDPVARTVRGFWPEPVTAIVDGESRTFHAPLGMGPGGSSTFYAATLERPAPHDLDASNAHPHPVGGWPVSFAEWEPWFDRAEAMLNVHGTPDPIYESPRPSLAAPPDPTAGDAAIMEKLTANGMHPYRLHAAVQYLPDCAECFGRKCPRPCKMDGRSSGIEPALASGRAAYAGGGEVLGLQAKGGRITGIHIRRDGAETVVAAARVVLAAGALSSPRIIMGSDGMELTGPIGQNLMFHLNEMFAVFPGRAAAAGPSKSVGFRGLYQIDGTRLGMVQAMGVDAGEGEILHILRERAGRSAMGRSRLAREALRLPAKIGANVLGQAKLFVGLIEDFPLRENRVLRNAADPMAIHFEYRIADELRDRRTLFRREIRKAFKGMPLLFLNHRPEPNFGHPCGTLAMSTDPAKGVVDARGRMHGIENLWVADASVFPTSMGVNPSLTIAAHALRVANHISKEAA